jgi:transcriptional antiterminator Rof (Rho-off)
MTPEESLDKFHKDILDPYLNCVARSWEKVFSRWKKEEDSLLKEATMTAKPMKCKHRFIITKSIHHGDALYCKLCGIYTKRKEEFNALLKEATMTLLEKLEVIKYQAKVIIEGNPDIDYIAYKIKDAPMSEIRIVEFEFNIKGSLVKMHDGRCLYQLPVFDITPRVSVFIWSNPVKISKEAEIEELP